ncbi:MAG: hypothetical protein DELT_00532 [Desulfovibrio sp.]
MKNILLALGVGLTMTASTALAGEPLQTGEAIEAKALYRAFQEDRKGAEAIYSGKTVRVKGVVLYAGPDKYGLPSVDLSDTPGGGYYVICVLPFTDFLKLRGVEKGQEITMEGEYRHLSDNGLVVVKQSKIVKD